MGVPVDGQLICFGDNLSGANGASIPESYFMNKHLEMFYHTVKEGIFSRNFEGRICEGKSQHFQFPN